MIVFWNLQKIFSNICNFTGELLIEMQIRFVNCPPLIIPDLFFIFMVAIAKERSEENEVKIKRFLFTLYSNGRLDELIKESGDSSKNPFLSVVGKKPDISDLGRLQHLNEELYASYIEAIDDGEDFDVVLSAFLPRKYSECTIDDPKRLARCQYILSKLFRTFKES